MKWSKKKHAACGRAEERMAQRMYDLDGGIIPGAMTSRSQRGPQRCRALQQRPHATGNSTKLRPPCRDALLNAHNALAAILIRMQVSRTRDARRDACKIQPRYGITVAMAAEHVLWQLPAALCSRAKANHGFAFMAGAQLAASQLALFPAQQPIHAVRPACASSQRSVYTHAAVYVSSVRCARR